MRIFELSKQLDIPSKELIELAEMEGIEVKNHMSGLTPEQAATLIESATGTAPEDGGLKPTSGEAPAAAEEVAADDASDEDGSEDADAFPETPADATEAEAAPEEAPEEEGPKPLEIFGPIVVKDLAIMLDLKPNQLIAELMKSGVFASINQPLEQAKAKELAESHGFEVITVKPAPPPPPEPEPVEEESAPEVDDAAQADSSAAESDPKTPKAKKKKNKKAKGAGKSSGNAGENAARPPVITFLGHVDHGKTSLVDRLRQTNVVAGEAGGITQHIGAYTIPNGESEITILDTPGHAAFTAMRARGANLTDIAVIVIAADDGIKPQTIEAIEHAKAAEVELVVAANKIDKPSANLDNLKMQLQQRDLATTDWGGSTELVPVSAITGEGMDELLELIGLQSEMLELEARASGEAVGYVIEAQLETGMGPTASVLVTEGKLKVGDALVVGDHWAKVKALIDATGSRVKSAGPSHAVKILGLSAVPSPGAKFEVVKNDREARRISEERLAERRTSELRGPERKASLNDLFEAAGLTDKEELKVILKCDVQGSMEALKESLMEIESDKVNLKFVSTGIGNVGENDALLASASDAILIGFNVGKDNAAVKMAKREGVEIRLYDVIYELIDDVRAAMKGLLAPQIKEKIIGHAEIRAIFKLNKAGNVAGCMVVDGGIRASCRARVLRGKDEIYKGSIASLKRFQDEVPNVGNGQECGIRLENFNDFETGDVIEVFDTEAVAQEL